MMVATAAITTTQSIRLILLRIIPVRRLECTKFLAFGLHRRPCLSTAVQEQLASAAVSTYCEPPPCHEYWSLSSQNTTADNTMWELWKQQSVLSSRKKNLHQQQQDMSQQSTTCGINLKPQMTKKKKNSKNNIIIRKHIHILYNRSFRKTISGCHWISLWLDTARSYPKTAAPTLDMPVELVRVGQFVCEYMEVVVVASSATTKNRRRRHY